MNELLDKADLFLFVLAGFYALAYMAQAVFIAGCMASGKANSGKISGAAAYYALVLAFVGVFLR